MKIQDKIEVAFPGWYIHEVPEGYIATSPFRNDKEQVLAVPITLTDFERGDDGVVDVLIRAARESADEAMHEAGI